MADYERLQRCVESLCASGCAAVRATIAALERGQTVCATEGLNESERNAVLGELKAVMAVYDRRPEH